MSDYDSFYTETQKALHAAHDSERLAGLVLAANVADHVQEEHRPFIESRDFFFLSTVDADGMPTVNYKGGAPGFVRIEDPKTLVFPNYDGNGMFLSMGNAQQTAKVGMLFIDFEVPHRIRVQGTASISADDTDMARYPGANMIVRVAVSSCFLNCGRYIHKYTRVQQSKYVPDETGAQPFPAWKRIDIVQDALREVDQGQAEAEGGTITVEDYMRKVVTGDQ